MNVKCSYCSNIVYKQPRQVRKNKTGFFFCNNLCRSKYYRRNYWVLCAICEKKFQKVPAEQKRHPVHCCSVKCRSEYNNKRIELTCDTCGKKIYRPPSLIKTNNFCTKECHDKFQTLTENRKCDFCEKIFLKQRSIIKRSRHDFCSKECGSKFVFKESFVECELEKLIKPLGLLYERNNRSVLGRLELDFYFPKIKYAIEVNGAVHYLPMYGEEVLAAQKIRDKRKRDMCKNLGIILRIVKPGDCKKSTYMPRYKRVVWEIKKLIE